MPPLCFSVAHLVSGISLFLLQIQHEDDDEEQGEEGVEVDIAEAYNHTDDDDH